MVSLFSVPLTVRDRVIGVFDCYTAEPHTFTRKEEVFFQTLANQTALAIENARLVAGAAIVREMHHRVKNNLQTIAMLLRMQMSSAPDRPAAVVLPEAINRILAIAAVHETLSESGLRLSSIKTVLTQIAETVVQNLSPPEKTLHVAVSGDDIELPSQAATALALATNELIQNALEHAFVGRNVGTVRVELAEREEMLTVSVTDDGVGLMDREENAASRQSGAGDRAHAGHRRLEGHVQPDTRRTRRPGHHPDSAARPSVAGSGDLARALRVGSVSPEDEHNADFDCRRRVPHPDGPAQNAGRSRPPGRRCGAGWAHGRAYGARPGA